MSTAFTAAQLDYLRSQRLCRLATVGADGRPHVVPTSFRVNDDGTVDIGGHDFAKRKKWRDVAHNPWVSLVVDDVLPPWRPRFIEIRGQAERRATGGTDLGPGFDPEHFHIVVEKVASFGSSDPPTGSPVRVIDARQRCPRGGDRQCPGII